MKKSSANMILKEFKSSLYYEANCETVRISNGHWLFELPKSVLPVELAALKEGKGGYQLGRKNDTCPEFDKVLPKETGELAAKTKHLIELRDGSTASVFVADNGTLTAIDTDYVKLAKDVFDFTSFNFYSTGERDPLQIRQAGEDKRLLGVIMPMKCPEMSELNIPAKVGNK